MCVLTLAWDIHPDWLLVAAGNRDEAHARPSAPLTRWHDGSGVIGGRDLRSGGMWLGVSEPHARFAVVTNVTGQGAPDPHRLSRGGLVHDALISRTPFAAVEPSRFNPFNLIVVAEDAAMEQTNRPEPLTRSLPSGWHALSNGLLDAPWDRKERLTAALRPGSRLRLSGPRGFSRRSTIASRGGRPRQTGRSSSSATSSGRDAAPSSPWTVPGEDASGNAASMQPAPSPEKRRSRFTG